MGLELAKMWVRIRGDSSELPNDLDEARRTAENSMAQLAGNVMGMVTRMIGTYASFQTMIGGLYQAGKFEQTTIAFETMIGSVEETKKTLEDLTEFAALTPFEMPEIEAAARGLIQFGERGDELMDTLNMLGNAASGSSTPFGFLALVFNQIRGVGKLLTQDFRQLSTRGILSLQDIAKHYGVTTQAAQTMLSKGKISFDDVRAIFKGLSAEGGRFHNLMERQSRSLLGLWSTLKDAMNLAKRAMGQGLLPVAKIFVDVAIKAVEVVRAWVTEHKELSAYTMSATVGILAMAAAFKALKIAGISAGRAIQMALIGTGVGIALVAIGVAVGAVIAAVHKMIKVWMDNETWMKRMGKVGEKLSQAWENIKRAVVVTLRAVASAVGGLMEKLGISTEWMENLPTSLGDAFAIAAEYVAKYALEISQWILAIAENWPHVWKSLGGIVKAALSYVGDMWWNYTSKFMPQAWGYALHKMNDLLNWLGEKIAEWLSRVVTAMVDLFTRIPELAVAAIAGQLDIAALVGQQLKEQILNFEKGLVGEAPKIQDIFVPSDRTKAIWKNEVAGVWDKIKQSKEDISKPVIEWDIREAKEKAAEVGEEIAKKAADFMPEVGARLSLPDLGRKIQDAMLKGDKDKKDDKRNQLLELGVKKQDELIAAVKEKEAGPARVG